MLLGTLSALVLPKKRSNLSLRGRTGCWLESGLWKTRGQGTKARASECEGARTSTPTLKAIPGLGSGLLSETEQGHDSLEQGQDSMCLLGGTL